MTQQVRKWDPAKVCAVIGAAIFAVGIPAVIIINVLIPALGS
jgi:hypothetical protein